MDKITPKLISWASIMDDQTRQQAITAAQMPFIFPHIALMPDAHLGLGATVGSVIPTQHAIMPAAIGVDLGCGMMAVNTGLTVADLPADRAALRQEIEARVPLSPGVYNSALTTQAAAFADDLRKRWIKDQPNEPKGPAHSPNWPEQIGSLGGGNHFIEVSRDELDRVWLFLHTGSRGVGNKIAQIHIKVAKTACERWFIDLPDPDLAYLPEGTEEFWTYIRQLRWAQKFAEYNRREIMTRVSEAFTAWSGHSIGPDAETINCHHNYTTRERHWGTEVWVSRKGAIDAHEGVMGLIPGSMGTASYVVSGKGQKVALCSAPHGAGRLHSRRAARALFTQDDLREAMTGIEYRDDEAFIDEHPGAYKSIDTVMADAADLVEIEHSLTQLVNVKGE